MKKLVILVAVMLAVPTMLLAAEPTVTISGSMEFNIVHRDNTLDFNDTTNDNDNFVDAYVLIDLKAELTDNVSTLVELGSQRHVVGTAGFNSADRFGQDGLSIEVKEVWVQMKEVIRPELTVKLGIQNFAYALRADGNYFLLNTKETANLPNIDGDAGNDAGGIKATYDVKDMGLSFDLFWLRAFDLGQFTGNQTNAGWFDIFGGSGKYFFKDEKSHIDALILNIHQRDTLGLYNGVVGGDWWAFSLGIDYFLCGVGPGDLELYGEAVYETGDIASNVDIESWAARVGAEFVLKDVKWTPAFGVNYWYLSGMDTTDTDVKDFLSFGKTSETLIMEDSLYGQNLSMSGLYSLTGFGNYDVWRVYGAVNPTDKINVKLQYNNFGVIEDFNVGSHALAQELDLKTSFIYSENVKFMLGLGWAWPGSFIKNGSGGVADDDAFVADLRTVVTF